MKKSSSDKFWLIILFVFYLALALISRIATKNQIFTTKSSAAGPLTSVTFQPSTDEFPNPERGFMRQSNIFIDQPYDPSKIGKKDPNDTVDWVYFHLEKYRDPRDGKGVALTNYQFIPLEPVGSGKGLDTVNKTFADARAKGLKLVIRFLYVGYGGIGSTTDLANAEPDAPLDVAQRHIDQLAPLIQQNKDVIAAVQGGFVGYWGEWHSSKYLNSIANRKAIVDKLLLATPLDRMVQIRYPRFIQVMYGGPILDSQAFNQSNLSRVGFHNDAFLRDDVDGGAFRSTTGGVKISTYCDGYPTGENQCWRDYITQTTKFTPAGGEAGTHSTTPSTFADCSNAVLQLSKQHFSFLHNSYSMVTLNHWVNQGCMPEIRRRLGYRFQLNRLSLSQSVQPGGSLEFHLEIENKGFASPYNPRPAILVLKNSSTGMQREIPLPSVDIRRWLPGQLIKADLNIPIPADLPIGNYNVFFWLPDANTNLKSRPEFSIRFANLNVWQTSGQNLIFNNLIVSGTPVTPGPVSNTPTRTRTPTQTILSPTNTLTPTRTRTPTVIIISPTRSLTPSSTLSPTRSITPSRTNTPTRTRTPTPINPSLTRTPTPISTTPTRTRTPTKTLSPTRSLTPTRTITPTRTRTPTITLTPSRTPSVAPLAAGIKFRIVLPDIATTVNIIPFSDVQFEAYDGATRILTTGGNLIRSGNYFQTPTDFFVNIPQNKSYTISIKVKTTLRRRFDSVLLAQSQTLDCTVTSNSNCGELVSQRDSKLLYSGDSDGFNIISGSYNKIDSADLQVLGLQFNISAPASQPSADYNFDGQVNILDLEILGKNYGQQGD